MRLTPNSTAYFSCLRHGVALAVAVLSSSLTAFAQTETPAAELASSGAPVKSLGMVTVNSGQPTSLPTQIPTTMEGVTREQIEQTVNAPDSEDALKYLPSLLVRKRYIGDYNHAVLSSRASGTGNSARSAVYVRKRRLIQPPTSTSAACKTLAALPPRGWRRSTTALTWAPRGWT